MHKTTTKEMKWYLKRLSYFIGSDVMSFWGAISRVAFMCFLGYWMSQAGKLFILFYLGSYSSMAESIEIANLFGWAIGIYWLVSRLVITKNHYYLDYTVSIPNPERKEEVFKDE